MIPEILTVAVPLMSGLIFVAYKHPKAYGRLYYPLLSISFALVFTLGAWDFGIEKTLAIIEPLISPKELEIVKRHAEPWTISVVWLVLGLTVWTGVLMSLLSFPSLFREEKKEL